MGLSKTRYAYMIYTVLLLYLVHLHNTLCKTISVPVVVLDDITHRPDSFQVLIIALRIDVMWGQRGAGIPSRACEVNSNLARGGQIEKEILRPCISRGWGSNSLNKPRGEEQ